MAENEMGFMVACLHFFGKKSGQTSMAFGEEVKALNDADRKELAPLLSKELGKTIVA